MCLSARGAKLLSGCRKTQSTSYVTACGSTQMSTFTFRVPAVSREGFSSPVRGRCQLMQRLFEGQTTLFHLAQHLSAHFNSKCWQRGQKTPGAPSTRSSSYLQRPMFTGRRSTPLCMDSRTLIFLHFIFFNGQK